MSHKLAGLAGVLHTRVWLRLARVAWLCVAMASLACLVVATPLHYQQLTSISPAPNVAAGQLSADDAAALPQLGMSLQGFAMLFVGLEAFTALVMFALGVLVFARRGDQTEPYMFSLALVTFGLISSGLTSPLEAAGPMWPYVLHGLQAIGMAALIISALLFPDGQFHPRWTRLLALAWLSYVILTLFVPALRITPSIVFASPAQVATFVWALGWLLAVVGVQVHRYRTIATPAQQVQMRWIIFGLAVVVAVTLILAVPVLAFGQLALSSAWMLASRIIAGAIISLASMFLGVCCAIALLRHRLFDIDVALNRTLVYGGATMLILLIYVVIVSVFGTLFHTAGDPILTFAAAAVVAVLFHPVRLRVQHAINRLMYGQRDDPYAVLARFGRQLEATYSLDTLLPVLVATIKDTLKLPCAAIVMAGSETPADLTSAQAARFPLRHQGECIGELIVAPREGEPDLSSTDQRLLEDLSRQAGVAIHAARVTADLQRARERLVVAREEERRRIRNDLHDGLAPTLSSLQLQLGAMRKLMRQNPDQAEASASELQTDLREATAEVRRLVYNLRPPALDELGLVGVLQSQAEKIGQRDGLSVTVNAPELPALPAAVEVAALRIAHEALMNVARHAGARHCLITLQLNEGNLILEIADDGRGLPAEVQGGIGFSSMRERAEELGGDFALSPAAQDGTLVHARLPLNTKPWTHSAS